MNKILSAVKRSLESLKTQPPLTGTEWANKYFYLSPESSGIEGKWETLPYQIGPLNWMCDDDIEEYNEQKSRRTGYTKRLLSSIGYYIEHKKRNIVLWQPKDGARDRFSKIELDTMLRDVPIVGDRLACKVGARHKHNTTEQKTFKGVSLDLKGGKAADNYRAMTKDVAMYDELSAFDGDIEEEGEPTVLGDGRLDDSSFPKSIRGSTPKIKGVCLIEKALKKCKFIFYRHLPCPHCGSMQRLKFENLKWENSDPLTAIFVCEENGCTFGYGNYRKMDEGGQWRTLDGYYYSEETDTFHDPDDNKIPKPRKIGVRLWGAYSYFKPWSFIAEMWIEASRESATGNNSTLKSVINTLLGETYEEKGESVPATGFLERLEEYGPDTEIPNDVLVITFGADIQGGKNPRIELEILGHGLEGETWSIDYIVIPGDAEQKEVWAHLDDQRLRTFAREDGVELEISGGFIDSGYLASEVYKYTGPRRGANIYATKGVSTGLVCHKGSWQGDKKSGRAILHTVNVDETKEIIFKRLKKKDHGPGCCHFPAHYKQQHFDQLTNEEKKPKKRAGRIIGYYWDKIKKGMGNEQLDCRSYNLGIFARLNPNLPRIKMRLDAEAERIRLNLPVGPRQTGRRMRSRGLRG